MAVTYTGSRVPRLPPEKLCCSRIVCREKKKTENEDGVSYSNWRRKINIGLCLSATVTGRRGGSTWGGEVRHGVCEVEMEKG